MSLILYWCWLLLVILDVFIGRNVREDWFKIFVIYHKVCNWISSQDINVLLVGPLFPFSWFSGGFIWDWVSRGGDDKYGCILEGDTV